jgi:PAS domain S-box-containing protein
MSSNQRATPTRSPSTDEKSFRTLLDTLPIFVCTLTPKWEVELVNQPLLDYFGKTLEELKNWASIGMVHPDDFEYVLAQIRHSAETGEPYSVEHRCRRHDGVFRWLEARGFPLRNPDGEIVQWYLMLVDIEDRRRAEDALRSTEMKLNSIFNSIPELAWSTRPDGFVEFLNQRWLDYTGMSAEDAHGWQWAVALHPEDRPALTEYWTTLMESGEAGQHEARLRRFDGEYRWFLFRAVPIKDETGNIVRWFGQNIDIEERKRAEDAIRGNERKLQTIINAMPVLAWSARADGSVEFFNQPWHDYTGLPADKAQDWGWAAAIHPDDLDILTTRWKSAITSGEAAEVEGRLRRFDGAYRWFLFRASALRDESGGITKWYGTNTDIDDRKRAEEQVQRSETHLAEGQKLSRTGTFSWRPGSTEVIWSEEMYRIHEIEPGTPITTDIARLGVHPDDLASVYEAAAKGVEAASDYQHTHRIVLPDGGIKFLHVMSRATRDNEGRLEYIGAVQDITERVVSEEALTKSRSELAHITRVMSLGILTASIAHEINQPLAGIITNAETCLQMLEDSPPDIVGARETALRSIRDGNRAADVITRLRSLFKKGGVVSEVIDLNEAAREVIALSSSELRSNRVVLQQDFAEGLPSINGDRVQLQQVIMNLLRNAIDAMRQIKDRPRHLLIRTEEESGKGVRLSVRDSGMGYTPESAERLFESFYSTKSDGMGIGLAISRSIVEAHHGKVWATLNDGPGSTFAFSLPGNAAGT